MAAVRASQEPTGAMISTVLFCAEFVIVFVLSKQNALFYAAKLNR
jgi:hypothetical protein